MTYDAMYARQSDIKIKMGIEMTKKLSTSKYVFIEQPLYVCKKYEYFCTPRINCYHKIFKH